MGLRAQSYSSEIDSIRKHYQIPELAYAVVSSDSIYELGVLGYQRINSKYKAKLNDRFRMGSNTKAITGYIAAILVKQGKIKWDTKFFDLLPELKDSSQATHHNLTLLNLLSFRTKLFAYTYTYPEPTKEQFTGGDSEQRYQFTKWFLRQNPVVSDREFNFSNLGYTAAGLMLEKVSGKSYKELVSDLGKDLYIRFDFGAPNVSDSLQPWGHNQYLEPEPPTDNFKLNWLLAAGNININITDYAVFMQGQLRGLLGKSTVLTKEEFEFLHYGLPGFAVGWFWGTDANNRRFSYNIGNPGTFLSKIYVFPEEDLSILLLANSQTPSTNAGLDEVYDALRKRITHKK